MSLTNQSWIAITMIVVGSSLAIGGFVLLLATERHSGRIDQAVVASLAPAPKVATQIVDPASPDSHAPSSSPSPAKSTVLLSSVEKGRKFEEWVVKRFRRDLFSIKEWRGDKFVDGIYAESSTHPDLEIEFHLRDVRERFAVECKWRGHWESGTKPFLNWATDQQIVTYKEFAQTRALPVFVVIGLGGQPDQPSEVFVVPLDRLRFANATEEYLDRFRRRGEVGQNFFFDPTLPQLR